MRIVSLLLLFLFLVPAWAQSPTPAPKRKIKTMVDYKEELSLTEEQIKTISTTLVSFQSLVKKQKTNLATYEQEYRKMIQEGAPLPEIKGKLRQIADTRFILRYADVLTSRRVSETLTDEQMEKWKAIQAEVRSGK